MGRRTKILLALLAVLVGLGGALVWQLHTWGRPLPVVYERLAAPMRGPDGVSRTVYARTGGTSPAAQKLVALDTDGDGTVDAVETERNTTGGFTRPKPDDPEARWLILCLDGVPYQEMAALWEEGYFREFFRPVPVISTFPSDSESALTDVFHAAPVPGYEHRYFDRARNELAGGALTTLSGNNIPYLERLDYDMPGRFKGLAYVLPRRSYRADLGRFRQRFLASPEKVFLAHIASSDSLYHIVPRAEMRRLLIEVDALLRELYFGAGGKLRITVFSDHGNSLVESRPVPLAKHLAANGWRLSSSLLEPRDVAVPAYGLVGFLAVYCEPRAIPALAADLAQMEGVDLVIHRDTDINPGSPDAIVLLNSVLIESPRGRARVVWKPDGSAYGYEPLVGDPMDLERVVPIPPIFDAIDVRTGRMCSLPHDPWRKDADFFAVTANHRYPDVGYRLRQWATNHVQNRADILVSLKPGYYYGSETFQHIVDILSTHGALDRDQSLGFAMSTDGPLAGPVRSRDLLPANLLELKGELRGSTKLENRNSKLVSESPLIR